MHVSLHVNERTQVQIGLSKCFTDEESSDLGYIMVEINWTKWKHEFNRFSKVSPIPCLYWQNFVKIVVSSLRRICSIL